MRGGGVISTVIARTVATKENKFAFTQPRDSLPIPKPTTTFVLSYKDRYLRSAKRARVIRASISSVSRDNRGFVTCYEFAVDRWY